MEKKRIKKVVTKKAKISPRKKTGGKSAAVTSTSKVSSKIKRSKSRKNSSPVKITDDYFEKRTVHSSFNFLGFLNDFAQALIIAAVIILLTISFIVVGGQKKTDELRRVSGQSYFNYLDDVKIVKKDKGFFGSLLFSSDVQSESSEGDQAERVLGMGIGSAYPEVGSPMDPKNDSMILPREIIEYNYIYVGDDFNLLPEEVSVYRRSNVDLSRQFADMFSGKKISFFDLRNFSDISVNNLTINEDRDYGYSIYLGLKDGNFSLYKNWDKWPSIDKLCRGYDQDCYQSYRLTINDFLSDEEIVNLSDNFLREYDIPLDNYGPGEVRKYWMRDYVLSEDKASFYFPDSISVIYPLKVEGVDVYDDSGEKTGLSVEIDMREKRVSGVYNLFYQHYESAYYSTERDKENILEVVKNGGSYFLYDNYREDVDIKTVDIQVGTPSIGMVRTWNYDETTMRGHEIYVPAYVFPVISESEPSYFYRKNIVVPAVKDFFNNNNRIYPTPLMGDGSAEGGGVPGSTGSLEIIKYQDDI